MIEKLINFTSLRSRRNPDGKPVARRSEGRYYRSVEKVGKARTFTIWTAPASKDVPALVQLDMRAPIAGATVARKRAAVAKTRVKTALRYYVSRSSAESLRKLVK